MGNLFNPPLQISHSSRELLQTCERKFQLIKLLDNLELSDEENPYFSRGHSIGNGIATYLATGDFNQAYFTAWLSYWPELELSEKYITQSATLNILSLIQPELDLFSMEWEVAMFNGKPAAELSFRLLIGEDFTYVGFVDLVVRNRSTGVYGVVEVKTTTNRAKDIDPLFKNSEQAVMYSSVLDQIVGEELSNYEVIYFVIQDVNGKITFHIKHYKKTLLDRLQAFLGIGLDVKHLEACQELGVFPRRGSKCQAYNKVCQFFGTCNLQGADLPKQREESKEAWQFTFSFDELVANHLRRI